jgi:cephalosporin hydroxylase
MGLSLLRKYPAPEKGPNMWIIAVAVLMNVIGLLSAAVALILIVRDEGSWRNWLSSRRGQGALCIFAGGCALLVGGQYELVRLLYNTIRQTSGERFLAPTIVAVFVIGAVLLAIGAGLLYFGGESILEKYSGPVKGAHWAALVTAIGAVILVLAGLNFFQYFTRPSSAVVHSDLEQPRQMTNQQVIDRFHELFYNSPKTWPSSKWVGVLTYQNPNDVWIHQDIISEVKPDFIIEAGTAAGGSAILWAMLLEQVNPKAKVITLDIVDQLEFIKSVIQSGNIPGASDPKFAAELIKGVENGLKLPIWKERVEFIKGSSTDPNIVAKVAKRVNGHKAVVILDSDHSKNHVLNELNAYAPLVNVGSYLIVQDTNLNGHPVKKDFGPGPMEAIEEFLATNKQFESDLSRERLLFTMHPKGYLKRIK